eukprot:TRINITY_DN7213_c0_g1_i1.p1 TRINITY_DN7213_c0_g1~~TRINITY_DN7213_c0_g1_i1.p1  ORF type:complete len:456 (+),score=38.47 TRINITY_DN7213_c0_g1_i1:64-1431(+)
MAVVSVSGDARWTLGRLPPCVLDYIAGFLCQEGVVGDRHPLAVFGCVCKRWATIASEDLWVKVWSETQKGLVDEACERFVVSMYPVGEGSGVLRNRAARNFKNQLATAGPAECLELGLLPREPPSWCKTPGQYQHTLYSTLKFCNFQVTSARVELQCMRGSIPVMESCAVLFSLIHIVWGGQVYLSASVPHSFRLLTRPMYCITLTWAFYLGAYAVYRVKLAKIHSIPEEAAKLWDVRKSRVMERKGVLWGLRYLKSDSRVKHAVAWLACLSVSVAFWHAETEGYFKEPLTLTRLLVMVFGPPTFTATIVTWRRSGGKIGLLAGTTLIAALTIIALAPWLLFFSLGTWSTSCLLRLHRGFYHPPRTPSALVSLTRKSGNFVLFNISLLCLTYFVAFGFFSPMLIAAVASLAVWVCVAVFIPLANRCRSFCVPLPYAYLASQTAIAIVGYLGSGSG